MKPATVETLGAGLALLDESGVVIGRTQGREAWDVLDLAQLARHLGYEITTPKQN